MAITITPTGAFVVLDETDGLQNATATPSPAGDADDNDILSSSPPLPTAFSGRLTTLGLTVDEAALSGYNGANTGSNILTVTGASLSSDFALTGANGVAFTDYVTGATSTFSSGLFAVADDGTITEVFLFADPTNNNIVYGVAGDTGDDPIAFAVYLEEVKDGNGITTGAKMWTVIADGYTLAHNTDGTSVADHDDFLDLTNKLFVAAIGDTEFSFANAPSGQNLFMMFGNTSLAILVTGEDPANQSAGQHVSNDGDTVSSSQGGGPTTLGTEGQHIKAQKSLVITFVTGANADYIAGPNAGNNPGQPLSPTEANVEANIDFGGYAQDVLGGEITISQMNPGSPTTTATVEILAYRTADGTGTNYINNNDPLVTGDAEIDIESVSVIRGGVDVTNTLTVTILGNSATITGVMDDDVIQYTTTDDHNRVLVRNDEPIGSNVSFDLGGFSLRQVSSDVEEIGSKVRFEDDGPTITVNDISGIFTEDPQTGTWDHAPGEDGLKSLNVTFDSYQIGDGPVTGGSALQTDDGLTYTGSITDDFNGDGVDETVGFTLAFDPLTDEYTFQMDNPPTQVITRDTTQGSLKAGGPDPVRTLLFGGSEAGADDVVFFGVVANAPASGVSGGDALADPPQTPNDLLDLVYSGATDLTEDQIQSFLTPANQIPTLINSATQMNVSTAGIGINNNNLDGTGAGIQAGDESFVFNPEEVVDRVTVYIDNSVGGYSRPTEELYYRIYFSDGTFSDQILVTDAILQDAPRKDPLIPDVAEGGKFFEIDAGDKQIDAVQLTMGAGTVKIPVIQWTIEQQFNPQPLQLDFTATIFDGDDDSQSDAFSIDLDPTVV
ncbi:hypothetical protein I6F26_14290 [Ensifer sp. IC3342]|nr:hypothetical protein [Ensifer sp. BRP08]MCA1447748.1 hypothetical protein [Ensifer sp. IC3342]